MKQIISFSHISEPDCLGFQVRIVRQGQKISRYFSHQLWGSKEKSLEAAIAWRDRKLAVFQRQALRFSHLPNRYASTGIVGVSRIIKHDSRCQQNYLCYVVFWQKNQQHKLRSFQVGNLNAISADQELHTFRTARLFRLCYEYALERGLIFNECVFNCWKRLRLYEQSDFITNCFSNFSAPR